MDRYLAVLNLKPGADMVQIKKAFRAAVQRYHPDANGGIGNPEKFKEVVKAYHYLQKNYKVLGIKPVRSARFNLSSVFNGALKGMREKFSSVSMAKAAQAPRKRNTYGGACFDPVLSGLPFDELKLRFLESDNGHVKRQAARALAYYHGRKSFQVFRNELRSCDEAMCEEIIFCLGIIGTGDAILLLEKYVRDRRVKVACSAVNALRNINKAPARNLLSRLEKEGRLLGLNIVHLFDNIRASRLVRCGSLARSEIYIARVLRKNTRQPVPAILQELGWVFPQ